MGKGSSTTETSNSQEAFDQWSNYDIPPEVKAAWSKALGMAGNAAGQPFTPYPGVPQAPFAPDSLEGYKRMREIADAENPLNQATQESALSYLAQTGQAPTQEDLQPYLNSYEGNVSDIAMERLAEQHDQDRQRLAGQKALAGSFGGGRFGIADAQMARDYARQKQELNYGSLQDNWDRAQGLRQQDLGYQGGAVGTGMALSDMLRNQQVANASNLTNIGQAFEQQAQGGLDFGVDEFGRGVQYPFNTAQFYGDMAQGIGGTWGQLSPQHTTGTGSSSSTGTATENPSFLDQLGQAVGIGKSVIGFFQDGGGVSNPLAQVTKNHQEREDTRRTLGELPIRDQIGHISGILGGDASFDEDGYYTGSHATRSDLEEMNIVEMGELLRRGETYDEESGIYFHKGVPIAWGEEDNANWLLRPSRTEDRPNFWEPFVERFPHVREYQERLRQGEPSKNYREGGRVMPRNYQDGGGVQGKIEGFYQDVGSHEEELFEAQDAYVRQRISEGATAQEAVRELGEMLNRVRGEDTRTGLYNEDFVPYHPDSVVYGAFFEDEEFGVPGVSLNMRQGSRPEDYREGGRVMPRNYQDGGEVGSYGSPAHGFDTDASSSSIDGTLRDQERQRQLEDLYYKWVSGGRGPETQAEIERLHEQLRETRPLMIYEAWENVTGNVLDNTWGPQPSWEEHFGNDTRREYADGGEVRPQATENLYAPWGRSGLMEMLSQEHPFERDSRYQGRSMDMLSQEHPFERDSRYQGRSMDMLSEQGRHEDKIKAVGPIDRQGHTSENYGFLRSDPVIQESVSRLVGPYGLTESAVYRALEWDLQNNTLQDYPEDSEFIRLVSNDHMGAAPGGPQIDYDAVDRIRSRVYETFTDPDSQEDLDNLMSTRPLPPLKSQGRY